jgi:NitT/TauT family transport system substrate-binding protein
MASVAFGDEQVIVVVNDNSTGNDKIICDGSITSIEDLAGRTIAAEAGVTPPRSRTRPR